MQKLALAAVAAAVVGLMATSIVPANAQPRFSGRSFNVDRFDGARVVGRWYGGWNNRRYWNNWNGRWNRWGWGWGGGRYWNNWGVGFRPWGWRGWGWGTGLAAGALGFAAGAALASSSNDRFINRRVIVVTDHVAACQARYRSYNPATDMFLGYDGNYHYCRL